MKGFCYVDGYYKTPSGKSKKWIRVKLSEVKTRIVDPAKNHDCYHTIQKFANPAPIDQENQLAGLFFDFDAADNLKAAQKDVSKLIQYFLANFELAPEELRVFFSGSKGFHLIVDHRVFDIQPHPYLTYRHKLAALWLEKYLTLKTLDMSAYSLRRQWRITDSVHPKSSLYKIELTLHEVENLSIAQITNLAKKPRGELYDDESLNEIGIRPEAVDWYKQFIKIYEEQETERKLAPGKPIKPLGKKLPACVEDLLLNHIRKKDTRNRATMTLASFFKDVGVEQEEAIKRITKWAVKVPHEFSDHAGDKNFLQASVPPVVKTVYENDGYHFLCNFARSLGSDELPIRCLYDDCPFTSEADQEPESPIKVHLGESSKVEFFGKKLAVNCIVSGKWDSPLIIPKKIRALCSPDLSRKNSKCRGCRMAISGGRLEKTFTAKDNEFLNLIQCSDKRQGAALKNSCGISETCSRGNIEILERVNVEEIQMIPQIENSLTDKEYVRRAGYFLGHGIRSNENYILYGYSLSDPRTQYACVAFSDFDTSASSLTDFKITPELGKELKMFQPAQKQGVAEKLKAIHSDLETNVTRIWGRKNLALAIDLVFHSVLSFRFLGKFIRKGWAECLIIGDSGQAKSTVAETLMEHYDLGHKISGEGAGRTGLAYSITTTGDKWFVTWGALPLNDRRLVVIDEMSGIAEEEIALLSELRSTGVVEVRKVVSAKTNARTRLIMMSNARNGYPLNTLTYPVTAITGLIPKAEDVRRLDFAVGVMTGEVPANLINRHPDDIKKEEHVYTSYYCKMLILWAWTRTVEQVVFTKPAEKAILKYANEMGITYSPKIPLVEPADQRLKIARLSAAVAARLFSCSDDYETLIVEKEHVDFVFGYLNEVYSAPALNYAQYSEKNRPVIAKKELFESLKGQLEMFPEWKIMAGYVLDGMYFTNKKLEDIMGYEKSTLAEVTKFLVREGIAKGTTRGYRVTEMGIDFLKRALAESELPF